MFSIAHSTWFRMIEATSEMSGIWLRIDIPLSQFAVFLMFAHETYLGLPSTLLLPMFVLIFPIAGLVKLGILPKFESPPLIMMPGVVIGFCSFFYFVVRGIRRSRGWTPGAPVQLLRPLPDEHFDAPG